MMGYQVALTPGTAQYYGNSCNIQGIVVLSKPTDQSSTSNTVEKDPGLNALDWISSRKIDLVINIPEGSIRSDEVTSGYLMRRAAVDFGTSLLTNIKYVLPLHTLSLSCYYNCLSPDVR
jgi:carbamoyl-phosphate synthase/aspartate carbamoyltransferase